MDKSSYLPKYGSLYAKVAIADSPAKLFISDVNLTKYAMTINMETSTKDVRQAAICRIRAR